MKDKNKVFTEGVKTIYKLLLTIFLVIGSFSCFLFYLLFDPNLSALNITESKNDYITSKDENSEWDKIENGIHLRTGLAEAEGLMEVVNNCTNCHSAKLVTQNRMTRERWVETIDWMQETQNLWDLGVNEEIIINYLVINYPPTESGRRQVLKNIEWYELKD